MLLIRGLLLAIGFFVVQAHVMHAASDCDGAGEEIAPMVFGEKFAHLKLAIAPWLSEYGRLINEFNERRNDSIAGFPAGLVPTMSDLEGRRSQLKTLRPRQRHQEAKIAALMATHNRLIAAGLVLLYECDYRPTVLSSSYVCYKFISVADKLVGIENEAVPADCEIDFRALTGSIAPKLFTSFSLTNSIPESFVGSASWVTARLLGLPQNMCVLDKKAAAALAEWQVEQLTDKEIGRRIGLIIAGEELRLPGPAAALLRQLMYSEYKVYIEELKKIANALREHIRECHTSSGRDGVSPS